MESSIGSNKYVKAHHKKQEVCYHRANYRESRWERAVKVYTINQESKYLLVLGIPAVGATKELLEQFALYGDIEEYRLLDEYPVEEFTQACWIKYKRIQSARFGKKKLDNRSFFGGLLHVCYAPEYENEDDTRQKLNERRRTVARKCKEYFNKTEEPTSSSSTEQKIPEESTKLLSTSSSVTRNYLLPPPPPPIPSTSGTESTFIKQQLQAKKEKFSEYPRVPTNQATLPVELQNLTAAEVYPNLEIGTSNLKPVGENSYASEESNSTLLNETESVSRKVEPEVKKQKRIVWNKEAPLNPFAATHRYTGEPGAWNPYPTVKSSSTTKDTPEETLHSNIRQKLLKTAEPSAIVCQLPDTSPLAMVPTTIMKEKEVPPVKKQRKNDGRKRI